MEPTEYIEELGEDNDFDDFENENGEVFEELAQPIIEDTPRIEDVMLKLDCEVGNVSLSLQEVLDLSLGSVINIGTLPPLVKINLNGKLIAKGMLVEISGRLGIKIISKV